MIKSEFGSPLLDDERPSARTLRAGEAVRGAVLGFDIPGRARVWFSISTSPVLLNRRTDGLIGALQDVTKTRNDRRFLSLRTEVGRIAIVRNTEHQFVQDVCNVLVDKGKFALAWFGGLRGGESDGVEVLWSAGLSDYIDPDTIAWWDSNESAPTAVAFALRSGSTQVVNDTATEKIRRPGEPARGNSNSSPSPQSA